MVRMTVIAVAALLALASGLPRPAAAEPAGTVVDAARAGAWSQVEALVAAGTAVDAPQPDGATALHWAAFHDVADAARTLLGAGAHPDAANDYGVTPLALACENGSSDMVATLLAGGADAGLARATGETPLHTCARTGSVAAVRALLSHGADVNAVEDWRFQTPLMWAAGEGHTVVSFELVRRGADVSAQSFGGSTALLIAARTGEVSLARVLLDAGAGVNEATPEGLTPLHAATVRGHSALAMFLLERGADPNADGPGYTPLHWASGAWHTEMTGAVRGIETEREEEWRALNEIRTGRVELVQALLAHGADPEARLQRSPPQFGYASGRFRVSLIGATPFLLAALDAHVPVMRALASAGADPAMGTDEGTTPLMVASGLGQVPAETRVHAADSVAAVEYVLGLDVEVNAVNAVGRSALHGAAHIRSDAIVQLLVDHGAAVNVADERGITPLMIAEGGGHVLLPGLGGGSTADLLRELGSAETTPSDFIDRFSQGAIR